MLSAVALLVLPILVACSGEGNIHLLEDEVATALRSCWYNKSTVEARNGRNRRNSNDNYRRLVPRIDNSKHDDKDLYAHEKRDSTISNSILLNGRENDTQHTNNSRTDKSVKYVKTEMPTKNGANTAHNLSKQKRHSHIFNRSEQDQCLSQCVFANLHVVDERGIPRETQLWKKVQEALTSQQSRTLLRDQIRACFRELQSEDEENGCSYSNKLERCLMLRFSDRIKLQAI